MPFFFIHLSDPQFGLFESHGLAPGDGTFRKLTIRKAIAAANRLKPAFVVITGDLVQEPDSPEHHAELMRITDSSPTTSRSTSLPATATLEIPPQERPCASTGRSSGTRCTRSMQAGATS